MIDLLRHDLNLTSDLMTSNFLHDLRIQYKFNIKLKDLIRLINESY